MNITQINLNGTKLTDPKQTANALNNFFVNVGTNTGKSIPISFKNPTTYLKNRILLDFIIAHTTENEILNIILSLDESNSTSPSSIPVRLFKTAAPFIILPLCKLINISFHTGVFPDSIKVVKVVPTFKSGSFQDIYNYRPTLLLSVFFKIIEKIMHHRLYLLLQKHDIIYKSQYGFQKNKSTLHSLIQIVEKIRNFIECMDVGFFYLKKAFDTVNHTILLNKHEYYDIRGTSLKWFTSYLSSRTLYVSIKNTSSDTKHITCGVPQGSVLRPLLFLLSINDLPDISNQFEFFLFADDTNIYFEANNFDKIQDVMNKGLKLLREWLVANRLALNVSKINFTIFSSPQKPYINITLLINKKAIEQKVYVKYLGVLFDSKLCFCHHISSIKNKISRAIGIMNKMKSFVSRNVFTCLYLT